VAEGAPLDQGLTLTDRLILGAWWSVSKAKSLDNNNLILEPRSEVIVRSRYRQELTHYPSREVHNIDKGLEEAILGVVALKERCMMTLGAARFYWGTKVIGEIVKSEDIKAAVMLQPARINKTP